LCAAFGIAHERADAATLPDVLAKSTSGIRVVEVPVPRDARRLLAARLAALVHDAQF